MCTLYTQPASTCSKLTTCLLQTRLAQGLADRLQANPRLDFAEKVRAANGEIRRDVMLPSYFTGPILGKQGDRIKDLQAKLDIHLGRTGEKGDAHHIWAVTGKPGDTFDTAVQFLQDCGDYQVGLKQQLPEDWPAAFRQIKNLT